MKAQHAVRLRGVVLLAIIFLLLAHAFAQTTVRYRIPLFRQEQALTDPLNYRDFWFELRPGVQLTGSPVLHLDYLYSRTILPGQGSLTVQVNGIPVASRKLAGAAGIGNRWELPISASLLKPGFNGVRIISRQRSIEGLCRDIDNDANWVRVAKTTTLEVTRQAQRGYPLNCYPFPCLDYLNTDGQHAMLTLPENPTPAEVQVMMETASNWGQREPFVRLPLHVTTQLPTNGNAVVFGKYTRWPTLFPDKLPAQASQRGAAWLESRGDDGNVRLLISGQNDEGMRQAARLLADPTAVMPLDTRQIIIPEDRHIASPQAASHKPNRFTFNDLGAVRLSLNGAFHQAATITLTRPVREKIGRESYLKIYFRHSATLNPRRSMLTVTVNGRKVGSVALSPRNIEGGTITVPIPVQELDADSWTIGLLAFHDLGALDCSKRYDEVAWTVVEDHSFIMLAPGNVPGYPTLANFPYLMQNNGRPLNPITLWLPAKPSDAMLSAAATIAASAGQTNHAPLHWRVVMGNNLPMSLRDGAVVMLGQPGVDQNRFATVRNLLPVWPIGNGKYIVKRGLKIVPEFWKQPAILEAASTSWGKHSVLYAVIGVEDDAFERLVTELPLPDTRQNLGAQIAVFPLGGPMFATATVDTELRRSQIEKETNRYTLPMQIVLGLLILLVLILLGRLLWMLRRHPPREPETIVVVTPDSSGT